MTTAEIFLSAFGSVVTLLIGIGWVGNVLIKRIEAKRDYDIKLIDTDQKKAVSLKEKLEAQNTTIRNQNDTIIVLRQQISAMQLKIDIIAPMLKRVLRDDPDSLEILKHLEDFDTGTNKTPGQ